MLNEFVTPVKLIILITLLFAVFTLKRNSIVHRIVLLILAVDCLTEFTTSMLIAVFSLPYRNVALLNIIIQYCLWLFLMGKIIGREKRMTCFILTFLAFAVINFSLIQGYQKFNYYTFILGALFYLNSFFFESFHQLKKENFEFIFSNNYLLLTAPMMFFLGMSLMFAFVSKEVTQVEVFPNLKLYKLVSDYVNILCYSIICLYIYKESKIKHGK